VSIESVISAFAFGYLPNQVLLCAGFAWAWHRSFGAFSAENKVISHGLIWHNTNIQTSTSKR
jgi:hypothetical protein